MIKIDNYEVTGWQHAIRGMRNPMNSWDKSDSGFFPVQDKNTGDTWIEYVVRENDLELMKNLVKAGSDHSKFMRMITVYVDVTAPLYWWKEADTYKVGTVANSCSTMHKITDKEFVLDDFSHEHLDYHSLENLRKTIALLNYNRDSYKETVTINRRDGLNGEVIKKDFWWQMIQLLPSSYNQKRTVCLNYAVLRNMYHSRKNHKLDEWREFCKWIETLPYAELITV